MRTQQQTTSTKISAFVCILGGTVNAQTSDASRGPVKWGEGLWGKRKQGNEARRGGSKWGARGGIGTEARKWEAVGHAEPWRSCPLQAEGGRAMEAALEVAWHVRGQPGGEGE